ncbi:MAG: L,D-transpeptidase [Blastocatellia bacterium]
MSNTNSAATSNANSGAASNANAAAPPAGSQIAIRSESQWAVTLPVLDAFLADETFFGEVKAKLQLTDQQMSKLKAVSHEATAQLREGGRENKETFSSAADHRARAEKEIGDVIGPEKVSQLFVFVADRWSHGEATAESTSPASPLSSAPVGVPADSRIVVNDPAFRMDIFENGRLIKSYKIGIGYPEFPLPTGLRKASTIIFNPTWTPPDEPWVESPSSKVEVGKLVKAGDKLNPLGLLKIPIGLPSLIHGGKSPAKIGNFASHGCVGLTDAQAKDFAKLLGQLGGVELTDDQIADYGANRKETKTVKLNNPVPVELRYETITVEDGKLHIYRDVYDRDTNTEQNLRAVLEAYGVTLEQLSKKELALVMNGLKQMSRDASGKLNVADKATTNSNASPGPSSKKASETKDNPRGNVTRTIKGQKEVVVEIAALQGKGYPAPVDLDTGSTVKPKKPSSGPRRRK